MLTNCNLLLQGLKDGLIMLDVDGYIKYANPAVTDIAGFSPDELLNESIVILYPDGGDPVKV
jgi:PAS domain S-box-containing protein